MVIVETISDGGAIIAAGVLGVGLGLGLVMGALVVRWLHRIERDDGQNGP